METNPKGLRQNTKPESTRSTKKERGTGHNRNIQRTDEVKGRTCGPICIKKVYKTQMRLIRTGTSGWEQRQEGQQTTRGNTTYKLRSITNRKITELISRTQEVKHSETEIIPTVERNCAGWTIHPEMLTYRIYGTLSCCISKADHFMFDLQHYIKSTGWIQHVTSCCYEVKDKGIAANKWLKTLFKMTWKHFRLLYGTSFGSAVSIETL